MLSSMIQMKLSQELVSGQESESIDAEMSFQPPHDKTNNVFVRPAKTQISLGIRPVWSESSLSAWRKLGSLATHWAHSEDSDQTERMPRLIWVFAGRTATLLVLPRGGSFWENWGQHHEHINSGCLHAASGETESSFWWKIAMFFLQSW